MKQKTFILRIAACAQNNKKETAAPRSSLSQLCLLLLGFGSFGGFGGFGFVFGGFGASERFVFLRPSSTRLIGLHGSQQRRAGLTTVSHRRIPLPHGALSERNLRVPSSQQQHHPLRCPAHANRVLHIGSRGHSFLSLLPEVCAQSTNRQAGSYTSTVVQTQKGTLFPTATRPLSLAMARTGTRACHYACGVGRWSSHAIVVVLQVHVSGLRVDMTAAARRRRCEFTTTAGQRGQYCTGPAGTASRTSARPVQKIATLLHVKIPHLTSILSTKRGPVLVLGPGRP